MILLCPFLLLIQSRYPLANDSVKVMGILSQSHQKRHAPFGENEVSKKQRHLCQNWTHIFFFFPGNNLLSMLPLLLVFRYSFLRSKIYFDLWLICIDIQQKPSQQRKAIILQLKVNQLNTYIEKACWNQENEECICHNYDRCHIITAAAAQAVAPTKHQVNRAIWS